MHRNSIRLILLFITIIGNASLSYSQQGKVIFATDFNDENDLSEWWGTDKYKFVKKDGNTAIRFNKKNAKLKWKLPIEDIRGAKVEIKMRVKAKNISDPPNFWNGVKAILHTSLPWNDDWSQVPLEGKDFDWQERSIVTNVPLDADSSDFTMGLEEVKGKVWIDYLEIKAYKQIGPIAQQKQDSTFSPYIGHNLPRLRGAMIHPLIPDTSLLTLINWGANAVRWQLAGYEGDADNYDEYKQWLGKLVAHLDSLLPICRQHNIKIALSLHNFPAGISKDYIHNIFRKKEYQDEMIETWRYLADHYKNETAIWGFDIANEPAAAIIPDGVMNWPQLATAIGTVIRSIDTTHAIIIEPEPNGVPESLPNMEPIPISKVVYSFHMYTPGIFTHQGVGGRASGIYYPGRISEREWNKKMMRQVLLPIKEWQLKHNVHLYVGEFSAARWAPGESAYYYIKDCIELFEEMEWDWTYHSYREYNGWSVEHSNNINDNNISDTTTLGQQLLIDWFGKNEH